MRNGTTDFTPPTTVTSNHLNKSTNAKGTVARKKKKHQISNRGVELGDCTTTALHWTSHLFHGPYVAWWQISRKNDFFAHFKKRMMDFVATATAAHNGPESWDFIQKLFGQLPCAC